MASYAILLAGGSGSRMRGAVSDKILAPLAGFPVLVHSLRAFLSAEVVHGFVIVCRDDAQQSAIQEAVQPWISPAFSLRWARGGKERRDSVLNGLLACPDDAELVFIHDSARPLLTTSALLELSVVALRDGAAVLAHRVKDTIKQAPPHPRPVSPAVLQDLDRSTLWAMETPQVFRHHLILDAYRQIISAGIPITDDVAAAIHAGHPVSLVENLSPNPKITEPHDLHWVEFLLQQNAAAESASPP